MFKIISVLIKELLFFIRLKSSWAVVYNGEQKKCFGKKFKEQDKLYGLGVFGVFLAIGNC